MRTRASFPRQRVLALGFRPVLVRPGARAHGSTAVLGMPAIVPLLILLLSFPSPVDARASSVGGIETPRLDGALRADTLELTLDGAFRRALGSNPGYRQTANELELNVLERRDAWLSLLPQPSLTMLTTSMNWQRQTVVEDLFGNPLPNPETSMVQTSRSAQNLSLNLSLDLGNLLNLREQETQARLRENRMAQNHQELQADVTQAFLDAQERALMVTLEEELLENADRNRDAALRLFRLARRERTDVVSAELDAAEQENALEAARFEYRNALLTLRNLIGDPDLPPIRLVEEPVRVFDPMILDVEDLVAFAARQAPPVVQQEASLESARRQVSQSRAEWLPTVQLNVSTGRQEFLRESGEAFFQVNPDGDWSRNVGIVLNFPDLGQYFRRQNTTRTREIQVLNQEEQLRQARLELDQNVRSLVVNLTAAHRSVTLQERRVALAQEQLDLLFESYRLGRADFFQLQAATESAAQARRQALQARYDFERARISLERTLGLPLTGPEGIGSGAANDPGSR